MIKGLAASDYELLIRAYWSPTAFDDWVEVGSGSAEGRLVAAELLLGNMERSNGCRLTRAGYCLVHFILNLPMPEPVWRIPGYQADGEGK